MFRLADMGKVWVPVELPQAPPHPGGEPELVTVHLLMQLYDDDELTARESAVAKRTSETLQGHPGGAGLAVLLDEVQQVRKEDRDELQGRISDWHGFGSEQEPVPFSAGRLAALLRHAFVFTPVRDALFRASREGVRKN